MCEHVRLVYVCTLKDVYIIMCLKMCIHNYVNDVCTLEACVCMYVCTLKDMCVHYVYT